MRSANEQCMPHMPIAACTRTRMPLASRNDDRVTDTGAGDPLTKNRRVRN